MSQTAKAQEPSMEEILASIRRIIADDDAAKPAPPKPAAAAPAPPPPKPAAVVTTAAAGTRRQQPGRGRRHAGGPRRGEIGGTPGARTAAGAAADVLDLTEAMAAPPPEPAPEPAPSFRTIDATDDVVFTDRAPEPRAARGGAAPRFTPPAAPDPALMSATTVAAVDSAFNSLANTVLGNNARTLEDLVKEMLRPMLKGWLDDNLPGLVERIVRAEIERVSRGR